MRTLRCVVGLFLALLVLVAGCGDAADSENSSIEVSDEDLTLQAETWVNFLGLAQTDPDVWRSRLELACAEGVWDDDVAAEMATEFIEQDLELSVRGAESGPPSVKDGAQALWIMAVNVCRDAFPEGAIEAGPPGL